MIIRASFIALALGLFCTILAGEDNPDMVIESRHMVAEIIGKELHVTDAILLNIRSVDDTETTRSFSIPAGYTHFEIHDGLDPDSLSFEEDHIVDTRHPRVGKMPIAFKYTVPVQRNTTELSFQVYHTTQVYYFLVKNPELEVASDELVSEGVIDMGERSYHALSAVALQPGERFTISLSGLGKQTRRKNVLIFAFIVVIILLIIGAFVFKRGHNGGAAPEPEDQLLERKKFLVSTIALLDEKHEKGEIGEATYRQLRKEFKEKLQQIIDKIQNSKEKNAQG